MKYEVSKERVLEALSVDLGAGRFFWAKPSKFHSEKIGMEAGCSRKGHSGKHYWVIRIDGVSHKRGHLVFLIVHGRFPSPCLDHINGDSLDDRPCNIREATILQNAWNHKPHARRIKLPMGVRIISCSGRYQARISYKKKQIHLGAFDTPEEAANVYQSKRKELYREFA